MEKIRKSKESWKKREPGARLSKKAQESELHFQKQREKMERQFGKNPQKVLIICNKTMLLPVGFFKSFTVKVKYPMTQNEFSKRIRSAFPELRWEGS